MTFGPVLFGSHSAYVALIALPEIWLLTGAFLLLGLLGMRKTTALPLALLTALAVTTVLLWFPGLHPLSDEFGVAAVSPFVSFRNDVGAPAAYLLILAMLLFLTLAPWHLGKGIASLYRGDRRLAGGVHTVAAIALTGMIAVIVFAVLLIKNPPSDAHHWRTDLFFGGYAFALVAPLVVGIWQAIRGLAALIRFSVAKPRVAIAAAAVILAGGFATSAALHWRFDASAKEAAFLRKEAAKHGVADALDNLNKALAKNPQDVSSLLSRGGLLVQIGQVERGLKDLSEMIKLQPDNGRSYLFRGEVYRRSKRTDLALADFGKAIELNPDDDAAYYFRAQTLLAQGRAKRALQDAEKALSLNPKSAVYWKMRARAHEALGQTALAASDYRSALAKAPDDEDARQRLRALGVDP